jgi:hypothetical protein
MIVAAGSVGVCPVVHRSASSGFIDYTRDLDDASVQLGSSTCMAALVPDAAGMFAILEAKPVT